jgi:uncharacterized damage-inducible protein DinB
VSDPQRYPVGTFVFVEPPESVRAACIAEYRSASRALRDAVQGLSPAQLGESYRPGGWTLAQVVHHVAESDAVSYPRLKFAITEPEPPAIMVAPEQLWAELPDARSTDIRESLAMFEAIRARWATAWEALRPGDFAKQYRHPKRGLLPVDYLLQLFAWHARHHTAQIATYRASRGW